MSFGSDQENCEVCEAVKIGMKMKNSQNKEIMLFSVPSICQALACQPINLCVEKFDHYSKLQLADSSDGEA